MAEDEKATETVATPEAVSETQPATVGKDGQAFDAERAQKTIEQLRAEAKELKAAKKRLEELEKAEQARKESEMSEIEKLKARAEQAEAQAQALKRNEERRAAAEKVGLPLQFADRLKGETPDELEADAKALFEVMPKPSGKTNITNPGNQPTKETDAERRKRLGLG